MAEKEEIEIVIDGQEHVCKKKEFKSGNTGYGLYGMVKIDGYPYRISLNLIRV